MAATILSRPPAFPASFADADAVDRTHFWYPCFISDRKTLMLPGMYRYVAGGGLHGPDALKRSGTTCRGRWS